VGGELHPQEHCKGSFVREILAQRGPSLKRRPDAPALSESRRLGGWEALSTSRVFVHALTADGVGDVGRV
jgi:hypothetical protein